MLKKKKSDLSKVTVEDSRKVNNILHGLREK